MKRKKKIYIFPDTDPRSVKYYRILDFPNIKWANIILKIILPIIIAVFLCLSLQLLFDTFYAIVIAIFCFLVYCIFITKNIILTSVKIYQRFAPR